MGGLFFCAWRESGLRRENPAVVDDQGVSGEENGVSLGDEHVSARRTRMIRRVPVDRVDRGRSSQGSPVSRVRS